MTHPTTPRYRQIELRLESGLAGWGERPPGPGILGPALVSAAAAHGDRHVVRTAIHAFLERGIAAAALREALLQTYLFAGYPRAINALAELAARTGPAGAELDLDRELGEDRGWLERGRKLCRRVYGEAYERLLATMSRISPDLGRWMVIEGYGKVLSRPGLDARTRELAALGALLTLDVPDQVRAHTRGALLVGATREDVEGVVEAVRWIAPEEVERVQGVVSAMLARIRS